MYCARLIRSLWKYMFEPMPVRNPTALAATISSVSLRIVSSGMLVIADVFLSEYSSVISMYRLNVVRTFTSPSPVATSPDQLRSISASE